MAVPADAPVVVKVCVMLDPDPFEAPLTPLCATVQVKVAPVMSLVRAIEVALPEQNACEEGVAVAEGIGLTVTVTTIGVPAQEPAVGVIV